MKKEFKIKTHSISPINGDDSAKNVRYVMRGGKRYASVKLRDAMSEALKKSVAVQFPKFAISGMSEKDKALIEKRLKKQEARADFEKSIENGFKTGSNYKMPKKCVFKKHGVVK